jgi:ABC-2 type transport system ATP-binding protein
MELDLKNLSKKFNGKYIFSNFNFKFYSSRRYALYGPNGSGKTTLLKIISNLVKEDDGEVKFANKNSLVSYINSDTKSFFQRLSPIDNLYFFGSINGMSKTQVLNIINEDFKDFNISSFMHMPLSNLSLGQVQIINIIRGFLMQPNVLLCDEIFANLDEKNVKNLILFLNNYRNKADLIEIYTSHNRDFLKNFCDEGVSL